MVCILAITALLKLIGLAQSPEWISTQDAVMPVQLGYMVGLAAIIEILVLAYVWTSTRDYQAAYAVIFLSVVIVLYRLLANMSGNAHCPCLGNIADWWPWLGRYQGQLLTTILSWLIITSLAQVLVAFEPYNWYHQRDQADDRNLNPSA